MRCIERHDVNSHGRRGEKISLAWTLTFNVPTDERRRWRSRRRRRRYVVRNGRRTVTLWSVRRPFERASTKTEAPLCLCCAVAWVVARFLVMLSIRLRNVCARLGLVNLMFCLANFLMIVSTFETHVITIIAVANLSKGNGERNVAYGGEEKRN